MCGCLIIVISRDPTRDLGGDGEHCLPLPPRRLAQQRGLAPGLALGFALARVRAVVSVRAEAVALREQCRLAPVGAAEFG